MLLQMKIVTSLKVYTARDENRISVFDTDDTKTSRRTQSTSLLKQGW
jgi:hypothetical protein